MAESIGRTDESPDIRGVLAAVGARWRLLALGSAVLGLTSALVLAVLPRDYRGTVVVVPVAEQRSPIRLPEAASFLGSSLQIGSGGFDATQDVVAYLLRSRSVLLPTAAQPYGKATLSEAIVGLPANPAREEDLLAALRRKLRVTVSRETGFVTATLTGTDSAAVRAFINGAVAEAQRVFSQVAQSQARELLRAQERRLDSAQAALRRVEQVLLAFDENNRVVVPRTRLSLDRARLEREVAQAGQVLQLATADRQAAVARELEDAPALAVVEGLPAVLSPWPKRILLRSVLLGAGFGVAAALVLIAAHLVRAPLARGD